MCISFSVRRVNDCYYILYVDILLSNAHLIRLVFFLSLMFVLLAGPSEGPPQTPASLKYVSLVLLTLQNALLILVMRYVRTREGEMFVATSAVIMSELFKFLTCLVIILVQVDKRNLKEKLWYFMIF